MLVWIIEMQINQIVTLCLRRKMGKSRGWKTSQRGDIVDAGTILNGWLCSNETNKTLAAWFGNCEWLPAEPLKKLEEKLVTKWWQPPIKNKTFSEMVGFYENTLIKDSGVIGKCHKTPVNLFNWTFYLISPSIYP